MIKNLKKFTVSLWLLEYRREDENGAITPEEVVAVASIHLPLTLSSTYSISLEYL